MRGRKTKSGIFMLGVLAMMALSACEGDTKDSVKEQESQVVIENNESVGVQDGVQEETVEREEKQENLLEIAEISAEKKQVEIFYGNENADGIISEVVDMEPVTASKVLAELAKKNIVSADTKVLGLTKQTQDGKLRLRLNMSKEFCEYVSMMGTTGEYIVVGSLVDTFLKAYDAEEVLILIEGELFETGHQSYENYLQFYPAENDK